MTVTVTDVNETPEISGAADLEPSHAENSSSAVATYTATDPERDTVVWSVNDEVNFWISSRGQLYFRTPPSYEDDDSYTFNVQASDGKDADGITEADPAVDHSIDVTVSVTDVEEQGSITVTPPRGWEGTRFTASLEDDDGGVIGLAWQWARSSNRSTWIDIGDGTLSRYTAVVDDANHYLRATATYEDQRGSNKSAVALAGRIAAEANPGTNVPPAFAEESLARKIGQGTAPGRSIEQPVRAADPDAADILSYSLTGPDAGDFAIDAATGQLRTKKLSQN